MMRTELDILHARMRAFEMEIKELKGDQGKTEHKAAG